MLSEQDKKEIRGIIASEFKKQFEDFKKKTIDFRAIKIADQSTDVKRVAVVADLLDYLSLISGGTFEEGANMTFGTGTGTKIGTSSSEKIGFWGATPVIRQTVTGSRGGNAALASLLTKLATEGLILDSTT